MKFLAVINLIIAAIGLATEFVKYKSGKELDAKEKAKALHGLRKGMKKSRKDGDSGDLEKAFANVGIDMGIKGVSDA